MADGDVGAEENVVGINATWATVARGALPNRVSNSVRDLIRTGTAVARALPEVSSRFSV